LRIPLGTPDSSANSPANFGGRVYFPTTAGKGFYVLQAMPKPAAAGG
jgi:hypothetical protein